MISEVGATERNQCCLVDGVADMWKFKHFFARRRDRTTAIMASRDAFKVGNMLPEKVDLSNINCHVFFPWTSRRRNEMRSTSATAIELRGAFRWSLSMSAIRVSGLAGSAANIDNLMRMLL